MFSISSLIAEYGIFICISDKPKLKTYDLIEVSEEEITIFVRD